MILFFKELISVLENLRPGFRKNHVFVLDNATWHKGGKIMKFFED